LIAGHPLRREIITTAVVNTVVNRAGISFAFRLAEETGEPTIDIVRAHLAARALFDAEHRWSAIEAVENTVAFDAEQTMLLETRVLLEGAARWLLRRFSRPRDFAALVERLVPDGAAVGAALPELLRGDHGAGVEQRRQELLNAGVPSDLATAIATATATAAIPEIIELAHERGDPPLAVAAVYFALEARLRVDRLAQRIVSLPHRDRWTAAARSALRDALGDAQRNLSIDVLATTDAHLGPDERVEAWAATRAPTIAHYEATQTDLETAGTFDI